MAGAENYNDYIKRKEVMMIKRMERIYLRTSKTAGNKQSVVPSEERKLTSSTNQVQGLDVTIPDKEGENGVLREENLKKAEKNNTTSGSSNTKTDGDSKKAVTENNGASARTKKSKSTIIVEPNTQVKLNLVNKPSQSGTDIGSTAVDKKYISQSTQSPGKVGANYLIKDMKSQRSNNSAKPNQKDKNKETSDKALAKDEKKKNSDSNNGSSRTKAVGSNKESIFVIAGGNGSALVENVLTELGWKKNPDKQSDNFKLKWVECRGSINYNSFKEGEQLVNRIPNNSLLTNKMGLLNSLQTHARVTKGMKKGTKIKLDFLPETYRLDDPKDKEAFFETYKEGEIWICKPTGMNQGKGIYLVQDLEELQKNLQEREERAKAHKRNMGRIIQRYIHKPLLLEGRKFDVRAYMLIASTTPYLLLFHKGYVRLSMHKYDNDITNLTAHLTNQYIQKKDPNYKDVKETTAWSMERFNDYINEHVAEEKGLEKDWVFTSFTARMKQIITQCFKAVQHKLESKMGFFDLYGLDFMIDEDMKIWLIEVNVNPSLATNCEALREVIPGVVKETLYLALECFEKSKRNQPLLPLQSQGGFQVLYNGSGVARPSRSSASPTRTGAAPEGLTSGTVLRSKSLSPVRRTRSLSPVKEASSNEVSRSQNKPTGSRPAPTTRTTLQPTQSTAGTSSRTTQHPQFERSPYAMAVATSDPIRLKMTHVMSAHANHRGKGDKSDRGN